MPTDPAQIPSNVGPILLLLQVQLATWLNWSMRRIIITALPPEQVPHYNAEQDVLLAPKSERPDVGAIDGGGRYDNIRYRTLDLVARTRLFLDLTGRDPSRLTDTSLGHFALEDKIVDAVELFFTVDANQNCLALPMRVGTISEPRREARENNNWVYSTFNVEFEYQRLLDTSDSVAPVSANVLIP